MHRSIRHLSTILVLVMGISFAGHDALAFMKRKDKRTVFEVPTTGKILDVKYQPEFDEWWVHCREGESIVVYTYDNRSQSWAKVTFTPKKSEERVLRIERPDKTKPTGDAGPVVPPKEEPKPEPPKPELKKEPDKKWWDPLKLLPGSEKAKPEAK